MTDILELAKKCGGTEHEFSDHITFTFNNLQAFVDAISAETARIDDESWKNQHALLSTARAEERAKVMKEVSETPVVAWQYEYASDLNGDKQGNWPVENITHRVFTSAKPSCESEELIVRPTFKE